jgi:hypothetical protein
MKHRSPLTLLTVFLATAGLADAAPWNPFRRHAPEPPRHEENHDRHDGHGRPSDRLEWKAQVRLKKLGYYRGPVDGDFGRGSRAALASFQRRNGLRPTGQLDGRTIRALRL